MKEPHVRVSFDSPIAVYEQIRSQIAFHIRSRAIEESGLLPSIRQLAEDLGVAKATVSRAYDALQREGLIVAERGQGMRVARGLPPLRKKERSREIHRVLREFLDAMRATGVTEDQVLDELKVMVRKRSS